MIRNDSEMIAAILTWFNLSTDSIALKDLVYKGKIGDKARKKLFKDITFVDILCGADLYDVCRELSWRAGFFQVRTCTYFNSIYLVCNPDETPDEVLELFRKIMREQGEKYKRSLACERREREMKKKAAEAERRRDVVSSWMEEEKMKVKFFKILKYRRIKKKVQVEPYSARIVTLAEEWAVGMQRAMREGKKVTEISENIEDFVDYDLLTEYMQGCAASFIAQFWKHGQKFRKWYNLSNQIEGEGERANKKPNAILNPAILSISVGGD